MEEGLSQNNLNSNLVEKSFVSSKYFKIILILILLLLVVIVFLLYSYFQFDSDSLSEGDNFKSDFGSSLDESLDFKSNSNLSLSEEELGVLSEEPPEFGEYSPESLPEDLEENVGEVGE